MTQKFITSLFATAILFTAACSSSPKESSKSKEDPPAEKAEEASGKKVSFTADEVYERLKQISMESDSEKKRPDEGSQFSLSLPSKKSQGDGSSEWDHSYISVFYRTPDKVGQVAVVTMTCNTTPESLDRVEIQDRLRGLVAQVSQQLFGEEFQLPKDPYFKKLGPDWKKNIQIPVQEPYEYARAMRLRRGTFKCDGKGGLGFRHDFFLN